MSDLCWDLPYHSGGWSSYLFCSGLQPCLYLPQHAQHVISAAWPPHTHRGHRTPASQAGIALGQRQSQTSAGTSPGVFLFQLQVEFSV